MKMTSVIVIAVLLIAGAYLALWPVPIEPRVWQPSANPGFTASFSSNQRLEAIVKLTMGDKTGPEDAIVLPSGDVMATSHEGWLVNFKGGVENAVGWLDLGGRPLGLDQDQQGNIWVANAYKGLQKVTPEGTITVELARMFGAEIGYADDVAVASSGKIYFSDATTRFHAEDWGGTLPASILDIVEHGDTGRVIEFDPLTGEADVIMTGLNFANGVAASPNDNFILVNETGKYRIWKHWIAGNKKGQSEIILEGLPGFPDNISTGLDGVFWVGLMSPRSDIIDALADKPFWRKVMMRLPDFLRPAPKNHGMILGITSDGEVLHNLQAPSGAVYATTGAVETNTDLFVTSLTTPFLAKLNKSDKR